MLEALYTGRSYEEGIQFGTSMTSTHNQTFNSVRPNQTGMNSKLNITEVIEEHIPDFPTHHALKLCMLGKAQSGKKTQSQQIIDEYGLTSFNMADILKEAFNYVNPNANKEEVADHKAKGKGKGSVEVHSTDIFSGLDATKYKETATALLKQFQITTGNETIPGKDTDILSFISDDALLVNLFLQKLKLTFHESDKS